MKGIVLAGGSGTRLHPVTLPISKQLLPVYDKPMIYYPLSVLMLAEIRDIMIISTPTATDAICSFLGDGSHLGLEISYAVQSEPRGIADAFLVGESFIGGRDCALVLGDNIFHGAGFRELLGKSRRWINGCVLFGTEVNNPRRYAVGDLDEQGRLLSLTEKPANPRSSHAITGLYFYNKEVVEIAKELRPSARGELEITDVNQAYLAEGSASLVSLGPEFTWFDAGTYESLLEASQFVRGIRHSEGLRIACLEEIALQLNFIDADACYEAGLRMKNSEYGQYVMETARSWAETLRR